MQNLDNKVDELLRNFNLHPDGPAPRYFTLPDLITLTGLGRSSIYRRCSDGSFPKPIKLGTRSLWNRKEFLAKLEQLETQGDALNQKLQPVTGRVRKRCAPC